MPQYQLQSVLANLSVVKHFSVYPAFHRTTRAQTSTRTFSLHKNMPAPSKPAKMQSQTYVPALAKAPCTSLSFGLDTALGFSFTIPSCSSSAHRRMMFRRHLPRIALGILSASSCYLSLSGRAFDREDSLHTPTAGKDRAGHAHGLFF